MSNTIFFFAKGSYNKDAGGITGYKLKTTSDVNQTTNLENLDAAPTDAEKSAINYVVVDDANAASGTNTPPPDPNALPDPNSPDPNALPHIISSGGRKGGSQRRSSKRTQKHRQRKQQRQNRKSRKSV